MHGILRSMYPHHLAILLLISATLAGQSKPRAMKVPDATAIRLSLSEPLSSATSEVDDPARFEVTEDVTVGGEIVIAKGATAVGHVVEVEPKRRLGRPGKLNLTLDYVKAVDESNLRLRAATVRKGDDTTGTVIVGTALLSPLFLIMRGKDVNIPKGTALMAYIDGDREITLAPAGVIPPNNSAAEQVAAATPPPIREDPATVVIKSDPEGADIIVDGKFFGNTPSTVQLSPGNHQVSMARAGYQPWQREITTTTGGIVTIDGLLEKKEVEHVGELNPNRQIPH